MSVHELLQKRFELIQQLTIPIDYKGMTVDAHFKPDILVNDCIIVELKTVEELLPVHEAQLYSYMKLLQKSQGLLINFNVMSITQTMRLLVNDYFGVLPDE